MRGVTCDCMTYSNCVLFQPALPMRGVTRLAGIRRGSVGISTRTPHAGSDEVSAKIEQYRQISTRTPHAGSDWERSLARCACRISTRTPHAGSDELLRGACQGDRISTRTPHAGSDLTVEGNSQVKGDFNPHSPCGE